MPAEKRGFFKATAEKKPVRATVTNRVAPSETTKPLGIPQGRAILPAATNELDLNGPTPYRASAQGHQASA